MQESRFYRLIKPLIPKPLRPLCLKYQEYLSYLVFGALTTLVNLIIFYVLVRWINYLAANVIAWVGAVIFAYVVNKLFVFESDRRDFRGLLYEIGTFFAARLLSLGLEEGILFLFVLDHVIPHLHRRIDQAYQTEGPKVKLDRTMMMVLAVTLHNIPEGMAVGVVYAGLLSGSANITAGGALALALGIAIQNFPEGAIISMPLFAEGKSKPKSFWLGVLSGAVEPVFGGLTVLVASLVVPAMPYLLSSAAGAMMYVVVEELIPEMSSGEHSNIGVIFFAVGFSLMMALDVALG